MTLLFCTYLTLTLVSARGLSRLFVLTLEMSLTNIFVTFTDFPIFILYTFPT